MAGVKLACVPDARPPWYISSRSANSLISFSRPTRIQAVALFYLNKLLDELLLHILSAARSLATDRIKTDGIVHVLGGKHGSGSGPGAQLAKRAVLEAELEMRKYLDGQRREGAKMPLGLSASSRFDGTEQFPVESAYRSLRKRCQFYSTLGELTDTAQESSLEQNIMSADGRPIATITSGVAIYVAVLLEFVAEHILQSVVHIMERDNSDEASLIDLGKALHEDEATVFWWDATVTRREMLRDISADKAAANGVKVQKPWQVPLESELGDAAGLGSFSRQLLGNQSNGQNLERSMSRSDSASAMYHSIERSLSPSSSYQTPMTTSPQAALPLQKPAKPPLKRRTSFDKAAKLLMGSKKINKRQSRDFSPPPSSYMASSYTSHSPEEKRSSDAAGKPASEDEFFDSLVSSGKTMKVSLTPSRLRSVMSASEHLVGSDPKSAMRIRAEIALLPSGQFLPPRSTSVLGAAPPEAIANSAADGRGTYAYQSAVGKENVSVNGQGAKTGGKPARLPPQKSVPPSAYRGSDGGDMNSPYSANFRGEDKDSPAQTPRLTEHHSRSPTNGSSRSSGSEQIRTPHLREMVEFLDQNRPPSPTGRDRVNRRRSSVRLSSDSGMKRSAFGNATQKVVGLLIRRPSLVETDVRLSASPKTKRRMSKRSIESSLVSNDSLVSPIPLSLFETSPRDALPSETGSPSRDSSAHPSSSKASRKEVASPEPALLERANVTGRPNTLHEEFEEPMNGDIDYKPVSDQSPSPPDQSRSSQAREDSQTPATSGSLGQTFANSSTCTISRPVQDVKAQDDPQSRKVPWAFSRPNSVHLRRSSAPQDDSTWLAGVSSNHGHHSDTMHHAPPSAWSAAKRMEGTSRDSVNTADLMSPAPRALLSPASSLTSPYPWQLVHSKTDFARLLSQLSRRVKEAGSIEECQRLVTHALAMTAAAVHDETGRMTPVQGTSPSPVPSNITETRSSLGTHPDGTMASILAHHETILEARNKAVGEGPPMPSSVQNSTCGHSPVVLPRAVRYRNLALPMAIGYDPLEDDGLPRFQEDGSIAAWLLGGDEEALDGISGETSYEVSMSPTKDIGLHLDALSPNNKDLPLESLG